MRVIIVHNQYQQGAPSGENIVVDDEIALLRSGGVDVRPMIYASDAIGAFSKSELVGLAIRPSYARGPVRELEDLIDAFAPDVVHVHNVYPLISPEIIRAAKRRGVRVVHSVHNYRLECANGTFFRDGNTCTDCLGRRFGWPAVMHACYRGSRTQSAAMAASIALHAPTWRMVDGFFVLHEFARSFLIGIGIDPDRVYIKSNMVPDEGPPSPRGEGIVYAGRLEVSKGIPLLLDAWSRSDNGDAALTIAGDGPLREYVEQRVRRIANVRFAGRVPRHDVLQLIDGASAVVVPSLWFEGAPLLVSEGASRGRPAVVMTNGGLPELVGTDRGWVAKPNAASLAETMSRALSVGDARWTSMSHESRRYFLENSSPEAVFQRLLALYSMVGEREMVAV